MFRAFDQGEGETDEQQIKNAQRTNDKDDNQDSRKQATDQRPNRDRKTAFPVTYPSPISTIDSQLYRFDYELSEITFLGDTQQCLVYSRHGTGAAVNVVRLMDMTTGSNKVVQVFDDLYDLAVARDGEHFVTLEKKDGRFSVNLFDKNGKGYGEIFSVPTSGRSSGAKIFWHQNRNTIVLIVDTQVTVWIETELDSRFELEAAISKYATDLSGNKLYVGLKNRIVELDIVTGERNSISLEDPIGSLCVDQTNSILWACSAFNFDSQDDNNQDKTTLFRVQLSPTMQMTASRNVEFHPRYLYPVSKSRVFATALFGSWLYDFENDAISWKSDRAGFRNETNGYAATMGQNRVKKIRLSDNKELNQHAWHDAQIVDLTIDQDQQIVTSLDTNNAIGIWDLETNSPKNFFERQGYFVLGRDLRNGLILERKRSAVSENEASIVKRTLLGEYLGDLPAKLQSEIGYSIPIVSNTWYSIAKDRLQISRVDIETGEIEQTWRIPSQMLEQIPDLKIFSLQASETGQYVFVQLKSAEAILGGIGLLFDFDNPAKSKTFDLRMTRTVTLSEHQDLFLIARAMRIESFKLSNLEQIDTLEISAPGSLTEIAQLSPNGEHVVVNYYAGSSEKKLRWGVFVLDRKGRKKIAVLGHHVERVTKVAFSADGKRLLTADQTGKINIWDFETITSRTSLN